MTRLIAALILATAPLGAAHALTAVPGHAGLTGFAVQDVRVSANALQAQPATYVAQPAYDARGALMATSAYADRTSPLPETSTWIMLGLGLSLVGFAARWRRTHPLPIG